MNVHARHADISTGEADYAVLYFQEPHGRGVNSHRTVDRK